MSTMPLQCNKTQNASICHVCYFVIALIDNVQFYEQVPTYSETLKLGQCSGGLHQHKFAHLMSSIYISYSEKS